MKSFRLGRPVSGSVTADRANCSRRACRSVMSSIWAMRNWGAPRGSRTIEPLTETHTTTPSERR